MFKHSEFGINTVDTYVGHISGIEELGGKTKRFDVYLRKRGHQRSEQILLRHGNEPHEWEAFSVDTINLALERNAWMKAKIFEQALFLVAQKIKGS